MRKLSLTVYNPQFSRLPEGFDGFTIAHIADLHNANLKGKLEQELRKASPDIIAITGDLINFERRYFYALEFVKNAVKIAPVFYVNGNHEGRFKDYGAFRELLQNAGVTVLENQAHILTRGGNRITLVGMNDHKFFLPPKGGKKMNEFKKKLSEICSGLDDGGFKILLAHRPEFFEFYIDCGIDLTLAGHAHGGQIRLPFIGAVFAPGQGFFPKYADGLKNRNEKYIAISRGLGHTFRTPPRIFNRRELVLIRLNLKKQVLS